MDNSNPRIVRVGKPSPIHDYRTRCQYAVETIESVTAPPETQCIELETMWMEAEDDFLRCLSNWNQRYLAKVKECSNAMKKRL